MSELSSWLFANESFQEKYKPLLYNSLSRQFYNLQLYTKFDECSIDYGYLLNCASVLSESTCGSEIDAALRICQYTIAIDIDKKYKIVAAFVLNKMANRPAIDLAVQNELIDADFFNNFGIISKLSWLQKEFSQKIYSKDAHNVIANRFQLAAWNSLKRYPCTTLCAPTSVGKSFIVLKWISEIVNDTNENIVYLVPTRALVHQVSSDILDALVDVDKNKYVVVTMPLPYAMSEQKNSIFVFTQERLHYFMAKNGSKLRIDNLVVDEAHKVGDGYRGILLQQAIEAIIKKSAVKHIVFATPSAEKPYVLTEDISESIDKSVVESDDITVNQNIFWVKESSSDSKTWSIEFWQNDYSLNLGAIHLEFEPSTLRKRLTFIAYSLGKSSHGNLIYADGAAEAEEIALLIYNMVGSYEEDSELIELSRLAKQSVHGKYRLSLVVKRGIAFHYGNMPLILRLEIERLFKVGKVKFLICTSTLVEGVNLPCKNIFVRGPKKGRDKKMSLEDFWNLAGRAGRWGKEFQGNIFCIDPTASVWINGEAPKSKIKFPITKTVDTVIGNAEDFLRYLSEYKQSTPKKLYEDFEYMSSYVASIIVSGGNVRDTPLGVRFTPSVLEQIDSALRDVIAVMPFSRDLIIRNPGVSPIGMLKLYQYFEERKQRVETLLPPSPSSDSADRVMASIFTRINSCFGPKFGRGNRGYIYFHALLTIHWMRGYPLPRIISERVREKERPKKKSDKILVVNIDREIRDSMAEVETVARFLAPKYLSCYCDVLKEFLIAYDENEYLSKVKDLSLVLEFGVPLKTQISLMSLGLSRATVLELSETIPNDSFTKSEAYDYLASGFWEILNLQPLMISEIQRAVELYSNRDFGDDIHWDDII